ncbi:uncharacterized protein LOC131660684 [Vicia villosa]|uniref:uncharacterized protein LOC131660684 n=1 Tax=Vicia villosa TaxID=3911 RepID=UPI00273C4EFE|nr:uncharacterized protein LOC131660684 [Vicia villosa]
MSRIDRILVSVNVLNRWGIAGQLVGERDISHNCPVWLVEYNDNWGPKPFKFNNEWFSLDSFLPFIEKEWKSLHIEGRGDFILKEKLRLLKDKLRRWNEEVFGRIDLEVEQGVRELNLADLTLEGEDVDYFEETLGRRKYASCRICRNMRLKENMFLQKARLKWMKEGDANSGFYHKVMKEKRSINHLGPIQVEGGMVESVEHVRGGLGSF